MKNLLLVIGLIALIPAIYFLTQSLNATEGGTTDLLISVVLFVVSLACFAIYFFKKFREEGDQEISITKF
ncbi:MAG TPA: hypothetical protein VIG62_07635 [Blastocatellia bacterium]|jgi:hypothetical protein